MNPILRILDANANRAREALRVMEEAARFRLGDAELTRELKQLRHDLAHMMSQFGAIEFHRDTPGDVGTSISTESEASRASLLDVVVASGKRLGESLRALEEYGKTIDANVAASMKSLRYRGYELERRLNLAFGSGRPAQWRLCVIITESLCNVGGHNWRDVARMAIDAGADCMQLREKELDDRELLRRAEELRTICGTRAALIINDRPDIAMLCGADGVHLGQNDLPCARVREIVGRQMVVGVSTSTLNHAKEALLGGADYCGVGPMFSTTTKQIDVIAGPKYLREYLQWNRLPHLAIGGITPANIGQLVEAGCRGIAVSSAICAAPDPATFVRPLLHAMDRSGGVAEKGAKPIPLHERINI